MRLYRLTLLGLCLWLCTDTAQAQSLNLDMGDDSGSITGRAIQMLLMFSVLSLAPSILMMITSFFRSEIVK